MAAVVAAKTLAEDLVSAAMGRCLPAALSGRDPLVRSSEHADFQSNIALSLARSAGTTPQELARTLQQELDAGPLTAARSGPGFLNLTLADSALWGLVAARLADPRLGVGAPQAGIRTVVDYSGPNIAKEMHVGHLPSTVIGDCLARVLGFLGGEVLRQNHLGDWGTSFGMLIQYLDEHPEAPWRSRDDAVGGFCAGDGDMSAAERDVSERISALDQLYRAARAEFEADAGFVQRSRLRVVALQSGDEPTLAVWRELVAVSTAAFQQIYDRLGVLLTPRDAAPESTYNPVLGRIVEELAAAGLAVESEGALCVFSDDTTGPDGQPVALIVRKQDGGYGYAATDLATLRHRVEALAADRILYVVDARQALHFRMVFSAARRAGWLPDRVHPAHVPFGMVLGPGGRPFKTRSGTTVALSELLDAAVDGARAAITDKPHGLPPAELERVVAAAGIGAVKYAQLSTSRGKNSVFDIEQMVSLHGDTGVYLQYAHARIHSILAKAAKAAAERPEEPESHEGPDRSLDTALPLHPAERALILLLDGFAEVLGEVATELEPHRLCGYLFTLAKAFTDFYGACPVLKAASPQSRDNRLALCQLTGKTLAQGLDLLGIQTPQRM
ncbi:arginine--tRNA ligase [Streptacidiphilus cavernicola]|uniref:Arginine--tRNA ligase n=1 Tax=Streptacidiphilus cavernicola TaxID=3342716 RepID=A0ABV6VUS1_9ACTN